MVAVASAVAGSGSSLLLSYSCVVVADSAAETTFAMMTVVRRVVDKHKEKPCRMAGLFFSFCGMVAVGEQGRIRWQYLAERAGYWK